MTETVAGGGRAIDDIAAYLDNYLRVPGVPDYPPALNGLHLSHRGPVRRVAASVDVSLRVIEGVIAANANLLLVHHGMFWGSPERLTGAAYERVRALIDHDIAVYSAHLPLDTHEVHGNSRLLAATLDLVPTAGFADYHGVLCGVRGTADVPTAVVRDRVAAFAASHGGGVVATPFAGERRTRHWAICSGAGAGRDTLQEAYALGVDTLIVGEGPHWTAVDAEDRGLVILYAGHYATETLGVQSLAGHIGQQFGLPWTFIPAPTGL